MTIDHDYERVEPDSPLRCQGMVPSTGQCILKRVEGSDYCPVHMASAATNMEQKKMRNFRLGLWQQRVNQFADNDQIKSLREEIGITRLVLEEIVNKCGNTTDLILYSNKIVEITMKIEKLVASCHRLEAATGVLIDKTQALHLADLISDIVGDYVTDEQQLVAISDRILGAVMGLNSAKGSDSV